MYPFVLLLFMEHLLLLLGSAKASETVRPVATSAATQAKKYAGVLSPQKSAGGRGRQVAPARSAGGRGDLPSDDVAQLTSKQEVSRIKCWGAHGGRVPLTPENLIATTVALRRRKYRTAENVLYSIKGEHISKGHPWSPAMALALRRARRIATRKLGPAKQAKACDLIKVVRMMRKKMKIKSKMRQPYHTIVAGSMLMYRGDEVVHVQEKDVYFDEKYGVKNVSVRLSHSKTDPRARGFTVRWSCVCNSEIEKKNEYDEEAAMLCLCCVMRAMALARHGEVKNRTTALPWFDTKEGAMLKTSDIAKALQALDKVEDIAVDDCFNSPAVFGAHSLRITGARWWYEKGMSEELIKKLARWASEMIVRYLADAPAKDLGRHSLGEVGRGQAWSQVMTTSIVREFRHSMAALGRHRRAAEKKERLQIQKEASGRATVESGADALAVSQQYVVLNLRPGQVKFHRVVTMLGETNQNWAAACGWKFGAASAQCRLARYEQAVQEKQYPLCGRVCFSPEEQARLRPTQS